MKVFCLFYVFLFSFSFSQGTLILAGGGSEGEIGDFKAWSYLLYQHFLTKDLQGDGKIVVAILAIDFPENKNEANWLLHYLSWIGKTLGKTVEGQNIAIGSREQAEDPKLTEIFSQVDAVFIKGGDQGEYYDLWKHTRLQKEVQILFQGGGSIGGTSAGAMSLSQYSLTGSADLTSSDVLKDSHSSYLNDVSEPHTSGIHCDFFALLPRCIVDTHYTQRGRMGRLIGILAKSLEDFQAKNILGIGIEQKTGLVIREQKAQVWGEGEVSFIQETPSSICIREKGHPLIYTHLRLDRLTHLHQFDLETQLPLPFSSAEKRLLAPFKEKRVQKISQPISFEYTFSLPLKDFKLKRASVKYPVQNSFSLPDAGQRERRAFAQEGVFQALYEIPYGLGFLIFSGGQLSLSTKNPRWITFEQASPNEPESATIVVDSAWITAKERSSFFVTQQKKSQDFFPPVAFTNLTVHILAESSRHHIFLDMYSHQIISLKK